MEQAMMGATAPQDLSGQLPGQAEPMPAQELAPAAPAAKSPNMIPSDVAVLLASAMNNAKMEAAKGLVTAMGDPRGTVNTRYADLLKVWRKRDPNIDPLYEKFVNGQSDEDIMYAMYPARRALIRYGRRTYTEQVEFAEMMAKLDQDPKYDSLDELDEDSEEEDQYEPPTSKFPSTGERDKIVKDNLEEEEEDEIVPEWEQEEGE